MDDIEVVCEETVWTFSQLYDFPIPNHLQSQGWTSFCSNNLLIG